jgi:glycerate 2-kinase
VRTWGDWCHAGKCFPRCDSIALSLTVSNLTQLRLAARAIFDEVLPGIDAGAAVRRAVHLEGSGLNVCGTTLDLANLRRVYSIAIGKAASAMASALEEVIGDRITAGVIASDATRHGTTSASGRVNARWKTFRGGHPEPNEESLAAAQACFQFLERANQERAFVIFLISGGGSAMIEWPIADDITLDDLRAANRTLVNSGASIGEINTVRRGFSAVKGGRLAARAPHCDQITLIVSDVPRGDEENVASGPTIAPPATAPDVRDIVVRYNFNSQFPKAVLRAMEAAAQALKPFDGDSGLLRKHFVLLDNASALEAGAEVARRRGFITEIAADISDQSIKEGCALLLSRLDALRDNARMQGSVACLISGGEFACPVKGDGIGGRNLETALRLAIEHNQRHQVTSETEEQDGSPFVSVCAGTDGIDGNSPAAGAIVDDTTIARARAIGLDPEDFLNRSDAYSFFVALGDVIATGPTGTNVRDMRILLTTAPNRGQY